jgi:hypothetical protein
MSLFLSPSKRSFRKEREFGHIVGVVFAALGGWWIYRGRFPSINLVFISLGFTLMVFGAVFPRALVYPNKAWMKLSEGMAYVSTRVILAIVYFLILTPIGVVKRATGWDPLHRREKNRESFWRPYSERQRNKRHYEKMF